MVFLTFEGIEGSGKSTQARRLAEAFGPGVVLTQEPGGTGLGRSIRELLLDRGRSGMSPEAEVLLFFADRAQHVAEVLKPSLSAGRIVISDRYVDSSLAYQGHGRGLPLDLLGAVARLATGGLEPDLTLFLDVPVELGLARASSRGAHDRLEAEVREFHERVREGYRVLGAQHGARWASIDGAQAEDAVFEQVRAAVAQRLPALVHAVR